MLVLHLIFFGWAFLYITYWSENISSFRLFWLVFTCFFFITNWNPLKWLILFHVPSGDHKTFIRYKNTPSINTLKYTFVLCNSTYKSVQIKWHTIDIELFIQKFVFVWPTGTERWGRSPLSTPGFSLYDNYRKVTYLLPEYKRGDQIPRPVWLTSSVYLG